MIARDPRPMEVYAVEFVVDNNTLGFVATDADKNITLFMKALRVNVNKYDP